LNFFPKTDYFVGGKSRRTQPFKKKKKKQDPGEIKMKNQEESKQKNVDKI